MEHRWKVAMLTLRVPCPLWYSNDWRFFLKKSIWFFLLICPVKFWSLSFLYPGIPFVVHISCLSCISYCPHGKLWNVEYMEFMESLILNDSYFVRHRCVKTIKSVSLMLLPASFSLPPACLFQHLPARFFLLVRVTEIRGLLSHADKIGFARCLRSKREILLRS